MTSLTGPQDRLAHKGVTLPGFDADLVAFNEADRTGHQRLRQSPRPSRRDAPCSGGRGVRRRKRRHDGYGARQGDQGMALSRRFSKGGAKAVGSQKGFPIRSLRIVGSRRHGVLTFPGLEPVLQQAGDPMRTVLVKNGILVDSGALRTLGILIAGDRAPHDTPGVETPFGVTWDEGINRGVHRRHGFRQDHEPESAKHSTCKGTLRARFRRRYGSCRSGMAPDRT